MFTDKMRMKSKMVEELMKDLDGHESQKIKPKVAAVEVTKVAVPKEQSAHEQMRNQIMGKKVLGDTEDEPMDASIPTHPKASSGMLRRCSHGEPDEFDDEDLKALMHHYSK